MFYAVGDSSKPLGGKVLIMNPKQGGCILMRKDCPPGPPDDAAVIAILTRLPRGSGATDIAGLMGPLDFAGIAKPADFVGSAQLTDSLEHSSGRYFRTWKCRWTLGSCADVQ